MTLSHPAAVVQRLEEIEDDLATRQGEYEQAALDWFGAKRDREKERAEQFLQAEGTVAARTAIAESETATIGSEHEAKYESLRAVTRVLETRASIGMAILKSQGRA
jgi:hypothetical protein